MKPVEESVIVEWSKKKKHIQDRINRIKKRLKKYNKQLAHFEFRLKVIQKYEKDKKRANSSSNQDGVLEENL